MTTTAFINPDMLVWARQTQGLSLSLVEQKSGLKKVQLWESGEDRPTMNQVRELARLYRRPSALFFMKNPPAPYIPPTDFRSVKGIGAGELNPETLTELRVCEGRRNGALGLAEVLGEDAVFNLPNLLPGSDVEKAAEQIRSLLGARDQELKGKKDDKSVLEYWIHLLEEANVLVFRSITLNGWNSSFKELRGSSAYYNEYPWMLLNSQEHPRGQLFTLGHELAHLLLHAGGVCSLEEDDHSEHGTIERFCNGFSAALLMPAGQVRDAISRGNLAFSSKKDIDVSINKIQEVFHTSCEAIARRLVTLRILDWNAYKKIREEQIVALADERLRHKEEGGGDGKYYFKRVLAWNGVKYTGLVMEAFHRDKISLGTASEYLRTKVNHFEEIRRELN